jgi:ferric-dicitrate binding protein FerR (iron transport regulator)
VNDPRTKIGEYLLGTIDDTGIAELSAWIKASPAHADEFVREAFVHSQLGTTLRGQALVRQLERSAGTTGSLGKLTPATGQGIHQRNDRGNHRENLRSTPRNSRRRRLIGLAAGLLLAAGVTTAIVWHRVEQNRLATVVAVIDTQWEETPLPAGTTLTRASYHLVSGLARIDFSEGSHVIVQGPATFTIDRKHLELTSGQAVVSCPTKSSRSLVVETDDARIVDLGTEYGVIANPGGSSRLQVFQGSVSITAKANRTQRVLLAGESWHAPLTTGPALAASFVREGDFELIQRSQQSGPDARWAGTLRNLSADPALVFCSDFNPLWDGHSVSNLARPGEAWLTAIDPKVPLEFVPGRLGKDQAIYVYRLHQGVRANIPGLFRSLTLASWIKLDPEPTGSERHRGIVMHDGWGASGDVHWQIKRHGIRLTIFDRGDDEDPRYAADAPALFDGGWHQCVSVIDTDPQGTGSVSHYLDGKQIYSRSIPRSIPLLTLGNCCVGNWVPSANNLADDRTLGGKLDDLQIWSRPLNADEVAALFASGAPGGGDR